MGKTPCYGLHLAKNRVPQMVIDVHADTSGWGIAEYGALGFYAGKLAGNRIPYFRSIRQSPTDSRRSALRWRQPGRLRSTMSRERLLRRRKTGSIFPDLIPSRSNRPRSRACFQISRWTPWRSAARTALPWNLQRSPGSSPGKVVTKPFYVFAAQGVIDRNARVVDSIEKSGARVFADTCMVVSPAMEQYRSIMVNSGKALAYIPDMCGGHARIGTIADCIRVATE